MRSPSPDPRRSAHQPRPPPMPDSEKLAKHSSRPLLSATLQGLGVVATTLAGLWVGPTGDWQLPAKPTTAIAGALVGILGVWVKWTYDLWKRDSKFEKVRAARTDGRLICDCSESGEIMLMAEQNGSCNVFRCPKCRSVDMRKPEILNRRS